MPVVLKRHELSPIFTVTPSPRVMPLLMYRLPLSVRLEPRVTPSKVPEELVNVAPPGLINIPFFTVPDSVVAPFKVKVPVFKSTVLAMLAVPPFTASELGVRVTLSLPTVEPIAALRLMLL